MHVIPCLEFAITWPETLQAVPWPDTLLAVPWPNSIMEVSCPDIRQLIQIRLLQNDVNKAAQQGYLISSFIVVEPDDTAHLVEQTVVSELRKIEVDTPIDEVFTPSFEWIIEHPSCYELAFIHCDREFGVCVFVPKADGIDADLLAVCADNSVPSPDLASA